MTNYFIPVSQVLAFKLCEPSWKFRRTYSVFKINHSAVRSTQFIATTMVDRAREAQLEKVTAVASTRFQVPGSDFFANQAFHPSGVLELVPDLSVKT